MGAPAITRTLVALAVGAALGAGALLATGTSARTGTSGASPLASQKQRCAEAATSRLGALSQYAKDVAKLRPGDRAPLLAIIERDRRGLAALRTKILSDGDAHTLTADCRAIAADYRVYALLGRQISLTSAVERAARARLWLEKARPRVRIRVTRCHGLRWACRAVRRAWRDLVSEASREEAAWRRAGGRELIDRILRLTPAGYPRTTAILDAARRVVTTMGIHHQAARSDLRWILATLKAPSRQPMPAGGIGGWRQIWTDNFTRTLPTGSFSGCNAARRRCSGLRGTAEYRKLWAYPDGWPDTSHHGRYRPSRVLSEHDGILDLYLHTAHGVHEVAAPVPILPGPVGRRGGLRYGRYTVRFRADPVYCYKTAWLLWPDSGTWPRDGEIDFPEGNLNGTIGAYVHHQGGTSSADLDAFHTSAGYGPWHTATTEWTPGSIRFLLDGAPIHTSTDRIPNTHMHWVLQTETGLDGCRPRNSDAGHVQIDWAAAYVPR